MKKLFIGILLLIVVALFIPVIPLEGTGTKLSVFKVLTLLTNSKEAQTVEVSVEGNTLYYKGSTNKEAYNKIYDALELNPNVNKMVLNSAGGDAMVGIDIGLLVHEHHLNVEVQFAFSSAANYIVTAADTLFIRKDAVIGWHGGSLQEEWDIPDSQRQMFDQMISEWKPKEKLFFETVGVDQLITVYGQMDKEFFEKQKAAGAAGYTYTIEDMKEMGIKNIVLVDESWDPEANPTVLLYKSESWSRN